MLGRYFWVIVTERYGVFAPGFWLCSTGPTGLCFNQLWAIGGLRCRGFFFFAPKTAVVSSPPRNGLLGEWAGGFFIKKALPVFAGRVVWIIGRGTKPKAPLKKKGRDGPKVFSLY